VHPWRTPAVGDTLATIMADGWPPLEAEPFGPWLLRASSGFTSRGNSVLVSARPPGPLATVLDCVEQWYAARSLPALVAVPTDAALRPLDGGLVDALVERRYEPTQPTLTMTASSPVVAGADRLASPVPHDVDVSDELTARWRAGFAAYRPLPDDGVPERILTGSSGQRFLSIDGSIDGSIGGALEVSRPIAVARMSMARRSGWAGLHAMWVDPTHRRRRLAHALAARLGQLAVEDGLDHIYLHVESANTVARQCYRQLGFVDHSGYVYYRQAGER